MAITRDSLLRVFLAPGVLAACASAAFADGKIFNRYAVAAPTPMPDQQAIIVYDAVKHVETLAVETRFIPSAKPADAAPGDNQPAPYAWVVPLPGPGAPAIRPATAGLFPTVRTVFQPPVLNGESVVAPLFIVMTALILALLSLGLLRGVRKSLAVLFSTFVLLLLLLILMPAIGSARARSGSIVQVLDRATVGAFDVAVVGAAAAASDPSKPLEAGKQLAAWLKDAGFTMPAGIETVLDDYAARHWVFAACKLHEAPDGSSNRALAPHPLIFTFAADQCVYPLKLTGVGNGPLSVDLYVFSNMRACAPGFEEVRCEELQPSDFFADPQRRFGPPARVALAHPELHALAEGMMVATKLSAVLPPEQQTADAVLAWLPAHTSGNIKYSDQGARGQALDLSSTILLTGVILLVLIAASKKDSKWVFKKVAWVPLIAAIVGGGVYAALPRVETLPGRFSPMWAHSAQLELLFETTQEILEANAPIWARERQSLGESGRIGNADALRAIDWARLKLKNAIPAQVHEEDSPFNFTLEPGVSDGAIDFIWYDAAGSPNRLQLWPPTPRNDAKLNRMR